nr:hypothetical protein FVER53263_20120 [Fusarium verticillioides]
MVPFKRALDIFVRRVRQLEPLFQQHGLDLPPVHDEDRAIYEKMIHGYEANSIPPSGTVQGSTGRDQDIIVGVDGTYPLHQPESLSLAVEMPLELDDIPTETTSVFPANSRTQAFPATETTMAAPETEQEARATDFGLDWIDWVDCQLGIDPTSSSSLADITSLDVSHSSTSITTGAAYDNNTLGNNEASEDEKELVFQLSDRMGHLHLMENGQSRFFGATSNFGLTKWKTTSDFGSFPSAQSPGSSVRCATSENADSALESLLEALYFSWADPAFHVVDREMYSHGKSLWQKGQESSPFYSPLLQYAICAYGCLLHDPRRKFESLAREYIGKLKELLEIELDCPKVATVQALVILSTFEAASAREARGWLYSGMAMRVSFDLGLHIDLGPYISNGEMSNAEANARSIAFWGCYIVDHLWGFYLGRPFQTNTGNITIQKPFMDNSHATPQWNPVGLERPSLTRDTLTNTSDQVDLIARQYGSKSASAEDLLSVANRTVVELREWKSALSMELQIDAEDMSQCPLPHLILLHMQSNLAISTSELRAKGPSSSLSRLGRHDR